MTIATPRLDKRTVLGGHYWTLGAAAALTPSDAALATALVAVGTYLILEPARSSLRSEAFVG